MTSRWPAGSHAAADLDAPRRRRRRASTAQPSSRSGRGCSSVSDSESGAAAPVSRSRSAGADASSRSPVAGASRLHAAPTSCRRRRCGRVSTRLKPFSPAVAVENRHLGVPGRPGTRPRSFVAVADANRSLGAERSPSALSSSCEAAGEAWPHPIGIIIAGRRASASARLRRMRCLRITGTSFRSVAGLVSGLGQTPYARSEARSGVDPAGVAAICHFSRDARTNICSMSDSGHTLNEPQQSSAHPHLWQDEGMASGDRLTGLDSSFLHLEDGPAHMHVASTTIFEGPAPEIEELREHILGEASPGSPLPPEAQVRPLRPGPADLDRRPALQPRLPRAPHRAPRAGLRAAAPHAGRPHLLAASRSHEADVGDVARRRAGRWALRNRHQEPSLPDRRRLRG